MKEEIILSEQDEMLIARIRCDVDHHTAKIMREKIDRRLYEMKPRLLVLDFSDVVFMDSSGLGLILGRSEKASAIGTSVCVSGLSHGLMRLVKLGGLDKIKNLTVTR